MAENFGFIRKNFPHHIRLLLSMAAILIITFLSLSLINYQISKESIRKDLFTSDLPLTRDTIYSEILRDLMPPYIVSSSMANDAFLKDWVLGRENLDEIIKYLKGMHEKYGYFSTFFVSDISNQYYHYSGILKKISPQDSHDVWYYNFINSKSEYTLDVDTNQANNDILTIFINFRVEDSEGKLLGVTGVGLQMDHVSKLFKYYQTKYSRTIYLVDLNGNIQVHSGDSSLIGKPLADQPGFKNISVNLSSHKDDPVDFEYKKAKRNYLATVRFLPEIEWYLIVEQDEGYALTVVKANLWRTLLVGLAASIIILAIMLLTLNYYQRRLTYLAVTDPLTGAANRRLLGEHYLKAMARHERSNRPFSVIVIDVDRFKNVNDTLGHVEGDRTLRNVADILSQTIRKEDLLARWGGDEFVVLVEGDLDQAIALGERMRELVEASDIPTVQLKVTLSLGVAEYFQGETLDTLTSRADQALFRAKDEGRNRIVSG